MEGINHSSRERHSWSDRRGGGVKRDKNVLSPFGSQGTLPWPPRSSPPPPPPLPFPGPFQPRHHHASSSHRPFVPIGSTPLFGHVNYSPAARLTTEEFDVAATARHPPLRSTPPSPPVSSLSLPVADSWARSRAGELMGGKGEFGNRGGKVEAFDSNIYLSIRGVRSVPIRLFLLVFLFIFIPVNICTRFDWSC